MKPRTARCEWCGCMSYLKHTVNGRPACRDCYGEFAEGRVPRRGKPRQTTELGPKEGE